LVSTFARRTKTNDRAFVRRIWKEAVSETPEKTAPKTLPGGASNPSGALVSLRGVSKVFANRVTALSGLNLDVREGEFLSLLGPSGCGKSTVLRLISRLTNPTSGAIQWRGGQQPEIGFVFQEPTLMPWATVFSNVFLPLRFRGVSKNDAKSRVEEALESVGLVKFINAYPRELSGGMKMRVSIARALVLRPPLLLMDEPFAALDEITRLKLNDDLVQLKVALGATIIFVTHSVYESVYLSTRIVVMAPRPGRIVSEISVPSPLPRDEEFRLSAPYTEKCRETSIALHGAMEGSPMA
jgi:NitT/TauT family transport system ATP-binding protein